MFESIQSIVAQIKQNNPLVLNVTNHVTMDFIANGLLSIGASPIMSQSRYDVEELLSLVSSVVVNIGTLNDEFIDLCKHTCRVANTLNKPIILDPVGVGATTYRTQAAQHLVSTYDIAIIRGNATEIMALANTPHTQSKGVDTTNSTQQAIDSALSISNRFKSTIVISGQEDVVVKGNKIKQLYCGSPMMPLVVGTGCLLSAVVGAFHAIETDSFIAAQAATLFYGVCGELAALKAQAPGSFKIAFLDTLFATPLGEHYAHC